MHQQLYVICAISAFLAGSSCGVAARADEPSLFRITTKSDADKVVETVEKGRAVIAVSSPTGIGQATIERTGATWPEHLILRLGLKGLEGFRLSNGKNTLAAAVSSHGDAKRTRLWLDDKEHAPLDRQSPLWSEIHAFDDAGQPTDKIPLKDGYFEIRLPQALFQDNPQSITLDWIDFYR